MRSFDPNRDRSIWNVIVRSESRSFDPNRDRSPFGLTLSVAPHWGFADETSGAGISHFGWEGDLLMDLYSPPWLLAFLPTMT
jgi:hypothetical protein